MSQIRMLIAVAALVGGLPGQTDPWMLLRVFEGKWEGPASGQPGKGVSSREYRFDLNGRFLVCRNKSVYEPRKPGAKGEVHEDLGLFSYDRMQKKFVLRQFHGEGFVNEYTLTTASEDGKSLEFVTTNIENIPGGWRAKETYRVISPNEIVETFALAEPGREFETYSETRLRRVR
ncbi:MAG: hypothetical protein HYX27_17915 [Acidobacteria bacterium]|nr:hypothetical protein [Acidobacteriota bacterium]